MEITRNREPERVIKGLKTKAARLESVNDQLLAEIHYVDTLLRKAGFEGGLYSLKLAAGELIEEAPLDFGS